MGYLSSNCGECEGDGEKVMDVIVRFDNEEQLYFEADNFFDNVYGYFNKGLPEGWYVDELPEINRLIGEEYAKSHGYVIFDPNI